MNQESAPLSKIPVVEVNDIILGDTCKKCVVKCPHCKKINKHGLGPLDGPSRWGHRACDWCNKGYYIQ